MSDRGRLQCQWRVTDTGDTLRLSTFVAGYLCSRVRCLSTLPNFPLDPVARFRLPWFISPTQFIYNKSTMAFNEVARTCTRAKSKLGNIVVTRQCVVLRRDFAVHLDLFLKEHRAAATGSRVNSSRSHWMPVSSASCLEALVSSRSRTSCFKCPEVVGVCAASPRNNC